MAAPFLDGSSRESFTKATALPHNTPGSWPANASPYFVSSSSLDSSSSHALIFRPAQMPKSPPTPPSNRSSGHLAAENKSPASRLSTPPIIQQSPPTPEDTPPKHRTAGPRLHTLQHALSTTDSFTTAREDQWSTDEDGPAKGSGKPAEQWWGSHQSSRLRNIGLGLGLESDDQEAPSPEPSALHDDETISLDGNWGEDLHRVEHDMEVIRDDSAWPTAKRLRREPPIITREQREQAHPSAEPQFGREIERPIDERYSQVSNTSTIIREALVMDLTPPKQPVLRHSGKNLAFRGSSFTLKNHALVHRNTQITNEHRRSIASELSDVPARRLSHTSQPSHEIIPVVIIPRRQSSLPKDRHRPSRSLTSGSISSRPVTGEGLQKRVPPIPPRSSSLSAPTSRMGSRAGSFTSAHSRPDLNVHEHLSSQAVEISNPSTPDVRQARAINFYPHTNQSVNLVVPHAFMAVAPTHVDSPLRHPRSPPDPPPQLMISPPTPANGIAPFLGRAKARRSDGPISMVRRALSQRRFFVVRRPSRVTEKKEARLHPFWRPRGFWDAFDSEEAARHVVGEEFLDRGWTPWLDNTLDASHRLYLEPGVTLAVDGNDRLRKVRWLRRISITGGNDARPATRASWTSVQRKMRLARGQRKERAAERKRRRLREMISGPVAVDYTTDPTLPSIPWSE